MAEITPEQVDKSHFGKIMTEIEKKEEKIQKYYELRLKYISSEILSDEEYQMYIELKTKLNEK